MFCIGAVLLVCEAVSVIIGTGLLAATGLFPALNTNTQHQYQYANTRAAPRAELYYYYM